MRPGTVVLRLVKAGPLEVRFRVPERDLADFRVGMPFTLTTQASGALRFAGSVTRLSAEVSRQDRTLAVEGLLGAEHDALRAGMYAEVTVKLGEVAAAVVIPSAALVERIGPEGERSLGAYVVKDEIATWQALTLRGRAGDRSAVAGLSVGESVVTLGHDQLREGGKVRIANSAQDEGHAAERGARTDAVPSGGQSEVAR